MGFAVSQPPESPEPNGFSALEEERARTRPRASSWRLVRRPSASTRNQPCIARAHLEGSRMRLGHKRVGVLGVDTDHQAALAAGPHGHVAADEEGETSEHLLFRDVGLAGDQLADAVGEIFVVRHQGIMSTAGRTARSLRSISSRLLAPPSREGERTPRGLTLPFRWSQAQPAWSAASACARERSCVLHQGEPH